jgi:hypothetical protein
MVKLLLTACVLGLLSSPAFAEDKSPERIREEGNRIFAVEGLTKETITRVVASGSNERLGFFNTLNPDCITRGMATVRVTKQPDHARDQVSELLERSRLLQVQSAQGQGRAGQLQAGGEVRRRGRVRAADHLAQRLRLGTSLRRQRALKRARPRWRRDVFACRAACDGFGFVCRNACTTF